MFLLRNRGLSAAAAAPSFAMELVEPSSIAFSGTSAAIVGGGSVTFTAVTSLSLNGVFSSTYDNYMVVAWAFAASGDQAMVARMRVGGVDASGSDYTLQQLSAQATTVSGIRLTTQTQVSMFRASATQRTGSTSFVYGPALAQPTAWRQITADGASSASIIEAACTHSLSTAYDGVTFNASASTVTGRVAVYGLRG
jgi:hypothetical protein